MTPFVFALAFAAPPEVTQACELPSSDAPLQVHLVSVTPGWNAMSALGHSMLLFSGGDLEAPVTYNWGAFDRERENLMRDFAKGELPYFLMEWPWPDVRIGLMEQGRGAVAQRLSLDEGEARAFMDALADAPDREGYHYDWATANCSTKTRDALDEVFDGALAEAWTMPAGTSSRYDIRRHMGSFVARDLTWSFIAGPEVDEPLTVWERALFPERLMEALQDAKDSAGNDVVTNTCLLLPGHFGWAAERPSPTWVWSIPGLLAGWLALAGMMGKGRTAGRLLGSATIAYGLFLAGLGSSTLLVALVTTMKGAGPTWGWAMAGPQSMAFVIAGIAAWRGRFGGPWTKGALVAVTTLALVGVPFVASGLAVAFLPGILACSVALWRGPKAQSQA